MVLRAATAAHFEAVVLPHLDAAYALARWLTHNDADAADVVQEACLRAFRYFDTYREGDAKRWTQSIVRRTCYTWLEQNRPADVFSLKSWGEVDQRMAAAPEAATTFEAALEQRSDLRRLDRLIAALPRTLAGNDRVARAVGAGLPRDRRDYWIGGRNPDVAAPSCAGGAAPSVAGHVP